MLLITTPNVNPEVKNLINIAQALGWAVYNDSWKIPERIKGETGAIYGEWLFCETVASQMNWTLKRNPLNWLATLPNEYTNRNVMFSNLKEAKKLTTEKFIKPADAKVFQAKIYSSGEELNKTLDDGTPVLISDVMKFTSEYRCIVKNREVISSCCYWYRTRQMENMSQPAEFNLSKNYNNNYFEVVSFVNNMLKDEKVRCTDSFVVDVGRFDKDKYAIIGDKQTYNSNLYGCDAVAMLDAIKASCVCEGN